MNKRILSLMTAVSMLTALTSGCGGKKEDGVTKLTWCIPGVYDGNDFSMIMDKVNTKLREEYNIELDLIAFDAGNYSSKLEVMHAAGESYDLAFTSNWTNSFFKNIENGVLMDLTDLLPKYAPTLYADMSDAERQALTVEHKLYAVPNWQMQASGTGLIIPKNKLEKTGMKLEDINTLEDFTTYFGKIHELEPKTNRIGGYWSYLMPYYNMIAVNSQNLPGAVYLNSEGKPQIINQYDTKEFKEYIATARSWVENGLANDVYAPDYNAGKAEIQESPGGFTGYKPGLAEEHSRNMGFEHVAKQFSKQVLSTSGIIAALTAVGANSKHPEEAVKLLEVMHTDSEIMNLLCWGLEGKHYEKVNDKQIKLIENSGYTGIPTFYIGSMANAYFLNTQPETTIEDTKKFNDDAIVSPVLGFNPILDKVSVECANCQNVLGEKLELLQLGLLDNSETDSFVSALKAAGSDTIIAELQRQLDEWWENK